MKKNIYYAMAIAATALFAACSSEDDVLANVDENQGITVIAKLPQEVTTRVSYVDESEGSTYSVKPSWEENDEVRFTVWQNSGSASWENLKVNNTTGEITIGKTPATDSYGYFYYPKGTAGTISEGSGATCTWPSISGNICGGMTDLTSSNILVGGFQFTSSEKTNIVNFKNIFALLKFQLKVPAANTEGTKAIKFILGQTAADFSTDNAQKKINTKGDFTLNGSTDVISWNNYTENTISVSKEVAFVNNSGTRELTFYALVIPQTFNGIYLQVNTDGSVKNQLYYIYSGSKELKEGTMYGIKGTLTTGKTDNKPNATR